MHDLSVGERRLQGKDDRSWIPKRRVIVVLRCHLVEIPCPWSKEYGAERDRHYCLDGQTRDNYEVKNDWIFIDRGFHWFQWQGIRNKHSTPHTARRGLVHLSHSYRNKDRKKRDNLEGWCHGLVQRVWYLDLDWWWCRNRHLMLLLHLFLLDEVQEARD